MTPWVNGQPQPPLAALMRGLVYGDGVFRTLRVRGGSVVAAAAQWTLLAEDAARLHLVIAPLADWLADSAQALAAAPEAGALRWIAVRQAQGRGYAARTGDSLRVVDASVVPPGSDVPLRCFLSDQALPPQGDLAGIKHLNRLPQVLASQAWPEGYDEALLCDMAGRLACGSRSTLLWVAGGRLLTPTITAGVAGFVRRWAREQAAELGLEWSEVAVTPDALAQAQEVMVGNSVMGIRSVAAIGPWSYAAPGPVCQALQGRFEALR